MVYTSAQRGERIIEIISEELRAMDRDRKWLAAKMGISTQAISKWGSTGQISRESAAAVVELLRLDEDRAAVLFGASTAPAPRKSNAMLDPEDFVIVPFHPFIRAGMGNGYENDERGQSRTFGLSFRRKSLERQGLEAESCFVLIGDGPSMAPVINDGDAVLCNTLKTKLVQGQIFAWKLNPESPSPELLIKMYGFDKGVPAMISANREFDPIPLPADAEVLGRVQWRSGWL